VVKAFLYVAQKPNAKGLWEWRRVYANGRVVCGNDATREAAIKAMNADHSWLWVEHVPVHAFMFAMVPL